MTESERQQMLTEAKILALASPTLIPLLEKLKREAFHKLLMEHREGKKEYGNLVAELNVISRMESEIQSKIQVYQTMELSNGNNNRK